MKDLPVDARAKELGLKSYDTALPQAWFDHVLHKTGQNPSGHFVWCYDRLRMMGEPIALTQQAEVMLAILEQGE